MKIRTILIVPKPGKSNLVILSSTTFLGRVTDSQKISQIVNQIKSGDVVVIPGGKLFFELSFVL